MSEKLVQTSELKIKIEGKNFTQRISYNIYDRNGNAILIQRRSISERHYTLRQLIHADVIRDEIKSTNLKNRADIVAFEKEWISRWPIHHGIYGRWSESLISLLWKNYKKQ